MIAIESMQEKSNLRESLSSETQQADHCQDGKKLIRPLVLARISPVPAAQEKISAAVAVAEKQGPALVLGWKL